MAFPLIFVGMNIIGGAATSAIGAISAHAGAGIVGAAVKGFGTAASVGASHIGPVKAVHDIFKMVPGDVKDHVKDKTTEYVTEKINNRIKREFEPRYKRFKNDFGNLQPVRNYCSQPPRRKENGFIKAAKNFFHFK